MVVTSDKCQRILLRFRTAVVENRQAMQRNGFHPIDSTDTKLRTLMDIFADAGRLPQTCGSFRRSGQ
jgi:hypothetical protein